MFDFFKQYFKNEGTIQTAKVVTNVPTKIETSPPQHDDASSLNEEAIKIYPTLRPEGLNGLLGEISNSLSEGTEASKELIGGYLLSVISVSIPRDYISMPYGALTTVPRVSALFVLPTGKGKGLAEKQANALLKRGAELLADQGKENSPCTGYARTHSGGLSSGEGLIYFIRDDYTDNKGQVIEGVKDKRALVNESEFGNLLVKANAKNSILSGVIRKLFDGDELEPLTKHDKTGCKEPHVAIVGHITAKELLEKLDDIAIANGFANRIPIFCGSQQVYQPIPKTIDSSLLDELATKLNNKLTWAQAQKRTIAMSNCYAELWCKEYSRLRQLGAVNSVEEALMARAAHYASMYAMLFAVLDESEIVTARHLRSALAWVDYWHESVRYVFDTEAAMTQAQLASERAYQVLATIQKLVDENNGEAITRTPLQEALGKKFKSKLVTEALSFLQELPRAPIKVTKKKHNKQVIELTRN